MSFFLLTLFLCPIHNLQEHPFCWELISATRANLVKELPIDKTKETKEEILSLSAKSLYFWLLLYVTNEKHRNVRETLEVEQTVRDIHQRLQSSLLWCQTEQMKTWGFPPSTNFHPGPYLTFLDCLFHEECVVTVVLLRSFTKSTNDFSIFLTEE